MRGKTSDIELVYSIFCLDEYPAKFLKDPRFIVDAGANVGYASVYFAQRFPNAEIVAIEPDAANFEMLKANTAGYKNIRASFGALWPRSEGVRIANPLADKWALHCEAGGEIPGLTVGSLLNGHGKIDLFKCDIEGAEAQVFSENAEWLARIGTLMIEIHPGCWKPMVDALSHSNLAFDCRRSGENLIVKFDPLLADAQSVALDTVTGPGDVGQSSKLN